MNSFIRERENGKFQAIISYKNGSKWKQKSKGGFNTKKEAKEWIKKATFEVLDLERKNIIDSDMTFKELGELYIEDLKLRKTTLNTIKTFEASLLFFKKFNDEKINKIDSYSVKKFIFEQREKTGNSYDKYCQYLKVVFNFAIKDLKILVVNPFADLKIDKKEDSRTLFISKDLYSEILRTAKNEKYKLAIETLYSTGIRVSEMFGITIFSLVDDSIKISRQWIYNQRCFSDLKTKNSERVVPISHELFLKLKNATTDINGRIFFDVKYYNLRYHLSKYNTSPHCLRHTFTTNILSAGIDVTVAASIVGDNIDTMMRVYAELNKDKEQEGFEKIRAIF